jgi:hypothetical protein
VGEAATYRFNNNFPPTLTLPRKGGGDFFGLLQEANKFYLIFFAEIKLVNELSTFDQVGDGSEDLSA